MRIGYFLSSEEFDPRELVRQARMAEDAGFDELYIQQIGNHHERFFDIYASEILPCFHDHSQAAALSSAAV